MSTQHKSIIEDEMNHLIQNRDMVCMDKHRLNQWDMVNSASYNKLKNAQQLHNEVLHILFDKKVPVSFTQAEATDLMRESLERVNHQEAPENRLRLPTKFVVSRGLNVIDYQKQDVEHLLSHDMEKVLTSMEIPESGGQSRRMSEDEFNMIKSFIPKGPTMDEIPVEEMDADGFISLPYVFDMDRITDAMRQELQHNISNNKINMDDIYILILINMESLVHNLDVIKEK